MIQSTTSTNTSHTVLEILVLNHPGVMSHICGLFARRAFNVENILCLPLAHTQYSKIWLLVKQDQRLSQMISQLEKLEDVQHINRNDNLNIFQQFKDFTP